jgi:dynein intermediate chain, cytosolic
VQTVEGSFDTPQLSEEEIRREIMEEVEKNERQRQAKLEDERKKSESTKTEELRGIILD